jgi:molybdopterin converting factor small subunit
MRVAVPTPLRSYTREQPEVEASGASLAELLLDLDRQFPGLRFRMIDVQDQLRPHMRIFVDRRETRELATRLDGREEIHIFQALSGG